MALSSPGSLLKKSILLESAVGRIMLVVVALALNTTIALGQTEGDYLYNITMLRAAPGYFTDLISALEESFELNEEAGDNAPFWMRHSQGDQWDFMLIYPMGDYASYYSPDRIGKRASVWESRHGRTLTDRISELTSYKEEWFARSVAVEEMARRFDGMGFFHVELFAGLPGKREELVEQRRMENRYYEHLDQRQNVLFVREAGSNWDAMTIGFYESLQTFAAAGSLYSESEQDEAAKVAGFEGVGTIGPYLRSLLSYHHDTLAVRVR
ncbi:MAG: hypothetical protein BMS9Abin05_1439 [Rhodothermia bacterium]|nr:MAG: hypothetical protein BMS9Abin05_1439 [Rhodothermia bacterium]